MFVALDIRYVRIYHIFAHYLINGMNFEKKNLFDRKRVFFLRLCSEISLTARTINPLTPNDPYSGRTAPLTSKRCILYTYSTNTQYRADD